MADADDELPEILLLGTDTDGNTPRHVRREDVYALSPEDRRALWYYITRENGARSIRRPFDEFVASATAFSNVRPAMGRWQLAQVGFDDTTLQAAFDEQFPDDDGPRLDPEIADTREQQERRQYMYDRVTEIVGT